ncbi:MAG: 30S ribosomal protein S18 [Candidatus Omnitrophica bacterium]|nr:30S ribosomal protein S18 [Candidatus Omnitrophota bacterium]
MDSNSRKPKTRSNSTGSGFKKREPRHSSAGRVFRKKVCRLCSERLDGIDYKDRDRLVRYLTEKGKIIPRRTTGNCAKCQRVLVRAIKRARHAGVLAFQVEI